MSETYKNNPTAKQQQYYLSCGILNKWHDKVWDDVVTDLEAKKVVQKVVSKVKTVIKNGDGIYLHGANGVGKTLLLNLAFQDFIDLGYKVHIISMPELLTQFTQGWYDNDEKQALTSTLQRVDFLGIENLGEEIKGQANLGSTVLQYVLGYRSQLKKSTWFTSTKPPKDIADYYSEDIASILREMCLDLNVVGADYRQVLRKSLKDRYM